MAPALVARGVSRGSEQVAWRVLLGRRRLFVGFTSLLCVAERKLQPQPLWSLFADDAVSVSGIGHHPLWETSSWTFASRYARFAGCPGCVAGVVLDGRCCCGRTRFWRARGAVHAGATAVGNPEAGQFVTGVKHLVEASQLCLGDREIPGALDGNPVNCVLAPVGLVFRFPLVRSSCTLGTVRAGRDGDEMLRIIEVVCVLLLSIGRPIPSAAVVGVPQRHHVSTSSLPGSVTTMLLYGANHSPVATLHFLSVRYETAAWLSATST